MLINSIASQYAATFKTHWCIGVNCLILVYTWLHVQLIVIDPYRSRYKKGMLFGINIMNVKFQSYHSIYDNVYKLQKNIFGLGFFG